MTRPTADVAPELAILRRLVEVHGVAVVADRLGVHVTTVYNWFNAGKTISFPTVKAILAMSGEPWGVLDRREGE